MGISGIGSNCNYLYNAETKKLQTKDGGTEDDFVKWFNGETPNGEVPESLNGFDYNRMRDIKNMFNFLSSGVAGGKVFNDLNGDGLYEVSAEVMDAVTSDYSIEGKNVFTAHNSVLYSASEIKTFSTITQPYRTQASKAYDVATNSISIGVGDKFDLGNGYILTVGTDSILGEGYGNGSQADDDKANHLVGGLNSLIHFADQQWFSSMIHEEDTPQVLELLESLGVDTSKEFTINGTKCEVKDGRIREVGNTYVVPSSIYNAAVKRYEENLYQPLSEMLKGRTGEEA